ncbi:hypothetical protein EYF80_010582 [Liparis tanakae]|uniref:Uncharacterized protein n=1 Tax=Liparis tanakae TaxID=230148 RepID=A0A4Z2INV3_9TELE|nr:hypothetical protein EYF80_010582 [Liparis tanakae]
MSNKEAVMKTKFHELCPGFAREQVEASAAGGEKGSLMQSSSLKSGTEHISGGREAANQGLWFVQRYVKRRRYTPRL